MKTLLYISLLIFFFTLLGCSENNGDSGLAAPADLGVHIARLEVNPTNESIPVGLQQQYTAIAILDDGTSLNITNESSLSWSSSDVSVATINTDTGLAIGVSTNTVTITAKVLANGELVSTSVTLTVNNTVLATDPLEDITANETSDLLNIPNGLPITLDMSALYSDGKRYSTEELDNTEVLSLASFTFEGDAQGASIDGRELDTSNMVSLPASLIVRATGKQALLGLTDTIKINVNEVVLAENPLEDVTANGISDALTIPSGFPITLNMSALYSDGKRYSTDDMSDEQALAFVDFVIEGDPQGVTLINGRKLDTTNISSVPATITVRGSGKGAFIDITDTIEIEVTDVELATVPSEDVTANGFSDKLTIAKGLPIRLEASALFSDGQRYSTASFDDSDALSLASFTIEGDAMGVSINGRELDTSNVSSFPAIVTVKATGVGELLGLTDTIEIDVVDVTLATSPAEQLTANGFSEAFSTAKGLPIKLDASALFSDGQRYSTADLDDAQVQGLVSFTIKGDIQGVGINGRQLDTSNVASVPATFTAQATGLGILSGLLDTIEIEVNDVVVASTPQENVTANGSSDTLSIAKGLPITLDASALFSDGRRYSTVDYDDDEALSLVSYTITGDAMGASITGRQLITSNMPVVPATITIQAAGIGAFLGLSDTIDITVTDAVLATSPLEDVTANTMSDTLTIAKGLPIILDMSALLSNGERYSTESLSNTAVVNLVSFTFEGDAKGASITSGRLLNTSGMSSLPATVTMKATGLGVLLGAMDKIDINVTDIVLAANPLEDVTANGTTNTLNIAKGVPIALSLSALFSDGLRYSTSTLASFNITSSALEASINGANLNTLNMTTVPGSLTVEGNGTGTFAGTSDAITINVTPLEAEQCHLKFDTNQTACPLLLTDYPSSGNNLVFLPPPTVTYLNANGYTLVDTATNEGKDYSATSGGFGLFRQDGLGVVEPDTLRPDSGTYGQFDRYCRHMTDLDVGMGDRVWRRPEVVELQALYDGFPTNDLNTVYSWHTAVSYATKTIDNPAFASIIMSSGSTGIENWTASLTASCVSEL